LARSQTGHRLLRAECRRPDLEASRRSFASFTHR